MKNQYTVVILPTAEEILRRLKTVQDDDTVREIYAKIAAEGGSEKIPAGIVNMFPYAIYDQVGIGELANGLHMVVPAWIDAIIEDKEVAEVAKSLHDKAWIKRLPESRETHSLIHPDELS